MLVTFTRAARNELIVRLQRDPDFASLDSAVRVTTLNAWGNRQVRQAMAKAKLISSTWDRKEALDNALQPVWMKYPRIKTALLDRRQWKAGETIFEAMETMKSLGFRHDQTGSDDLRVHVEWLESLQVDPVLAKLVDSLSEFGIADGDSAFVEAIQEEFAPFFGEATLALWAQGKYSFEDQKYRPYLWINDELEAGRSWSGAARTHHLIVDEFQDINPLDLGLIKAIAQVNNATLTLAGDDDQAIYEWRGASPEFILDPSRHLGGDFETFVLETNYRSPRNIVEISQRLIAHNTRRVPKDVSAAQSSEAKVEVLRYQSVASCVAQTTEYVRDLLTHPDIRSIALLSRKRSQIVPYQITLASSGVSFYAAEDLNLGLSGAFEELTLLLAYRGFRDGSPPFAPRPTELVLKLADKVRKQKLARADRTALLAHLQKARPSSLRAAVAELRTYTGPLKGDNADASHSRQFADAMEELLEAETVTQALRSISNGFAGFQADYGKSDEDIYYTDPPFYYLAALAESYGSDFEAFARDVATALERLAQVPSDDGDDAVDEEQVNAKLHLMTALRAKGREFDAVIVLDVNDGIWPSRLDTTAAQLEQARRLFYVATTRVRKVLRYVYSDRMFTRESRIAADSDDSLLAALLDPGALRISPYVAELGLSSPQE